MRKVKPEDEIPIVDLSPKAIEERRLQKKPFSKSVLKRFYALDKRVVLAQERDEFFTVPEFMPRLYKVVDMLMKEATEGRAVCRKGCAWCCKIPVTVTAVEAAYIHYRYGVKINEMATKNTLRGTNQDYCPLLDRETGTCTVYEARPLACRTFFTYDNPKLCENENTQHLISSVRSHEATAHLAAMLLNVSQNSPYADYADIRDWVVKND